jgi:hypothetical protein
VIAIFDIDGVLADARHREHHLQSRPRDWDGFFAAVAGDSPIEEGIRRVADAGAHHEIVLLSGRPESTRQETTDWLGRHGVWFDRLVLRADGDHRPAPVMKADLVGGIAPPDQVAMVVDDDGGVVERLAALGYPAVRFAPLG